MKIIRDGKEYELTENEMRQAWDEIARIDIRYHVEDIFQDIADETPDFELWRRENEEKARELIEEAVDEIWEYEDMHGHACSHQDKVREVIEYYDDINWMFS